MEKGSVFFSHSSKDMNMILPIKEKVCHATGNCIEIFMSSDGESIPFGRNWVHKIEDGLNSAAIMFVFVTPNSVNTAWIYFEAGYAYSKGIKVIPVGIGVSIGQLKAPLSLLQGFDVLSKDSLNNFISILNQEFKLSFNDAFEDTDYQKVVQSLSKSSMLDETMLERWFSYAEYDYYPRTIGENNEKEPIDHFYTSLLEYVKNKGFNYSIDNKEQKIILMGIEFHLVGRDEKGARYYDTTHSFRVRFTTYNFLHTFEQLRGILSSIGMPDQLYLRLCFAPGYTGVVDDIKCSAIVHQNPDLFSLDKDHIGSIIDNKRRVNKFHIWEPSRHNTSGSNECSFNFSYNISAFMDESFLSFLNDVISCKMIYKLD